MGSLKRIQTTIAVLVGIVTGLVALQAALAQLFPKPLQDWFNAKVGNAVQSYLSYDCDLTGNWICRTAGCAVPPPRQATITQKKDYELVFRNERIGDPDSMGIWVRQGLVFVPRYDPGHGGDFGRVSKTCDRIEWSDSAAVWERQE
jgi:hypothetical protein